MKDPPNLNDLSQSPAPLPKWGEPKPAARRPPNLLVFSPLAWLKLQFFLHAGDTEVGGFGISAAHDLLYVQDLSTVRQSVTAASVEFDDAAVADHFDRCVDAGLRPGQFARLWMHTHPGESPEPSLTDERTFARVFGRCDWAVMFILGRTGRTYARLSFGAGPGGEVVLGVAVDWPAWPRLVLEEPQALTDHVLAWAAEYDRNVHPAVPLRLADAASAHDGWWAEGWDAYDEYGLGFSGDDWPQWGPLRLPVGVGREGGEGEVPA